MSYFDNILDGIGRRLADRLERQAKGYEPFLPPDQKDLRSLLQPADVLLVEGNQKIATAIKYLTQSTWSHAALYIGDALGASACGGEAPTLVEANLGAGVVAAPLSRHTKFNTRISRPVGLTDDERSKVVRFAVARIGHKYDTRNIIDLAISGADTSGAGALAPTDDRAGFGRANPRYLLDAHSTGVSKRSLSHSATHRARTGATDRRKRLQPPRDLAYSASQPVYAARLRSLTLLPDHQANH